MTAPASTPADPIRGPAVPGNDTVARLLGHALAALFGLGDLVGGVAALFAGAPAVVGITLVITGALTLTMLPFSLRDSRAAWSVLVAVLSVFGVVTLFGAPTAAHHLHIPLAVALLEPLLLAVASVALAQTYARYRE